MTALTIIRFIICERDLLRLFRSHCQMLFTAGVFFAKKESLAFAHGSEHHISK